MIKGKQVQPKVFNEKSDVNYRKLDALNQSMLKLFDSDPVKFYEEFKQGKKRKEKKNTSIIIGDIVDFYLLSCRGDDKEFEGKLDEKFVLFNGVRGTGQVFVLADYLFEETENCLNERGEITCSFETRFNEAVRRIRAEDKYKGKDDEKILEDFNKNGLEYFKTRMDSIGKTVVDISLIDKAKTVAKNIINDDFTKDIFKNHDDMELLTHFPIEWKYDTGSKFIPCKSELDILSIDHERRVIQPMDLKTTYDNESFDYMYIKNSYYLQNAFYHLAVKFWANENEMKDYEIKPMKFIVGDTSSNNRRPLIYSTSMIDVQKGLNGFSLKGTNYRGVINLIEDIVWAEYNNEWTCSKEAFEKKGKMNLNIAYDEIGSS